MTSLVITSLPFSLRSNGPTLTSSSSPSTSQSSTQSISRLDLSSLVPSVQRYCLAPSTQRTYSSALKSFHKFCVQYSVMNPFLVTEHLLCCFAAFLADQGLTPQTEKLYFSVVQSMQISLGPILSPRSEGGYLPCGTPPRIRIPITTPVLSQIRRILDTSSNPRKVVLWPPRLL